MSLDGDITPRSTSTLWRISLCSAQISLLLSAERCVLVFNLSISVLGTLIY
jgi:hypothetical protein